MSGEVTIKYVDRRTNVAELTYPFRMVIRLRTDVYQQQANI